MTHAPADAAEAFYKEGLELATENPGEIDCPHEECPGSNAYLEAESDYSCPDCQRHGTWLDAALAARAADDEHDARALGESFGLRLPEEDRLLTPTPPVDARPEEAPDPIISPSDAQDLAEHVGLPARLGRTAAELLQEVPEEPDWLVPGLLATGWTAQVAGREKLGKGTFEIWLLGRLEQQKPTPFGDAADRPVTALIYTEEPSDSLREKVERAGLERARVIFHFELSHIEGWDAKVKTLVGEAEAEGHELVFVDNISRAAEVEDENDSKFGRSVERFMTALRGAGLTGLFDHHHRKRGGAVEDKSRGSTSVGGAVDVIIDMSRDGGGSLSRKRKLNARGRLSTTNWERVIELSEDGREYDEVDGSSDEMDRDQALLLKDRMTLQELGECTADQFAAKIGQSSRSARYRLNALVSQGIAAKDTTGKTHIFRPAANAMTGNPGF